MSTSYLSIARIRPSDQPEPDRHSRSPDRYISRRFLKHNACYDRPEYLFACLSFFRRACFLTGLRSDALLPASGRGYFGMSACKVSYIIFVRIRIQLFQFFVCLFLFFLRKLRFSPAHPAHCPYIVRIPQNPNCIQPLLYSIALLIPLCKY